MSDTTSTEVELPSDPVSTAQSRHSVLRRGLEWIAAGTLAVVMAAMLLWAGLAVFYADTHAGPRKVTALLFVLVAVSTILFVRPRRYGLIAFALLFLTVLGWFFSISPSDDRDWSADSARAPWAEVSGDRVTIHNVRNCDYRTETDVTPRWEDRTYDLASVSSVDLMLVHWGSPDIAHAMVSFGFSDGRYLAISIETRKERTESYSTAEGFFRQYELLYVVADERDVVRLRTNYRKGEDVYLYQTNMPPKQARKALESYLHAANSLKSKPRFYNALTSNCATNVLEHARQGGMSGQFTMDVVLSGRAASQAYRNDHLDTSIPFDELRRRSLINSAARAADRDPQFSKRIRDGLPKPAKVAGGTVAVTTSPADSRPAP